MDKRLTRASYSNGEITHISPVLRLASGKDGELSLRIFEPEGADEDWEMESFWEYEEEAA